MSGPHLRWQAILLGLCMGVPATAGAAVGCAIGATAPQGTYTADNALVLDGSFTVTCTRSATDPQAVPLYIGVNQPPTGREMTPQSGSDRLPYGLYRTRPDLGLWTDGPGTTDGSPATGGLLVELDFASPGNLVAQRVVPFYAYVPAGLNRQVGWYQDAAVPVSVRQASADGALLASTLLSVSARIADQCRITPPPGPLVISYTAFMATAAQCSALFDVTCTLGTAFTIALDPPSATMDTVDISYQLSLDAADGQGSAQAQTYRITGTAAPGQRGRCAGGVCRASRTHSIVVSY